MLSSFFQNVQQILLYSGAGVVMLILGFVWFDLVMTRGFHLRKELYDDDNHAAGQVVACFLIALVLVIAAVILGERQAANVVQDLISSLLYFVLAMVLFTIIRIIYKLLTKAILKVDVDNEIFEQDNLAAAKVEGAVYLAMGIILAVCVY